MQLTFSKMQGLGNDFVVIDAITQACLLTAEQIRYIASRRFGIGCDQVLLVEKPGSDAFDFFYRIYNADGSEAQHCGNGARCFMLFVHQQGLSHKNTLLVETANGQMQLQRLADGQIRVAMAEPNFEPVALPFKHEKTDRYTLPLADGNINIGAVSMGNPHAVMLIDNINSAPVDIVGPQIESHGLFPERVNAGFMQVLSRDHIKLRVYERGTGETPACGTGACAAVAVGIFWGLLDSSVIVDLKGGKLAIDWQGHGHTLYMTGSAEQVFQGVIEL